MRPGYVLAPEAAVDLAKIWSNIRRNAGLELADRVESEIFGKIKFLASAPGCGHWRRDLTDEPVKFFPVYSYLIIYLPSSRPLQVVSILHGKQDIERLLSYRLSIPS